MDILIDNHKAISLEADLLRDELDTLHIVLGLEQVNSLLEEWVELDQTRRRYDYGDADGNDPTPVIIARCDTPSGTLVMERVEPFWNGLYEVNGYDLEELAATLGIDTLRWGEEIGAPDPLAGVR